MFHEETPLIVARHGDYEWQLTDPLVYEGKRDTFTIPAGYVTDFASVPRMLQWFAPSTGKYTLAAVLHDYLCDQLSTGAGRAWLKSEHCPPGHAWDYSISSRDVDGLFRRVMREQKVPAVLRWFMWAGVRWGALFNRNRRTGSLRTLPLVLLLTVLALPIVVPAVLCIWFAYAVQFAYEAIVAVVTEPWRWWNHE